MGRKTVRIKQKHISSTLIGKEADIILNTNEVFHGFITKLNNEVVTLNSLHAHILNFELQNISEIILSE